MNKKILSILGDYYHDHDLALEALKNAVEMLNQSGADTFELVDSGVEGLEKALSQKFDLVILGKENRVNPTDKIVENWMTPEIEVKILEYVRNGGSWMAWHSGLCSYEEAAGFISMLRGYFLHHPSENKNVRYIPKENNSGISLNEAFEAVDEHYFVKCDTESNLVFLEAESADGECEAGWAHEFDAGRVCCLTPTHREEGLTNKLMLKTLCDCIKWCCKGAGIAVTADI